MTILLWALGFITYATFGYIGYMLGEKIWDISCKKSTTKESVAIFQEELIRAKSELLEIQKTINTKIALLDKRIKETEEFLMKTKHESEGARTLRGKLIAMRDVAKKELASVSGPLMEILAEEERIAERMQLIELYRDSNRLVDIRGDEARIFEESIRGMEVCRRMMRELSEKKIEVMLDAEISLPEVERAAHRDAQSDSRFIEPDGSSEPERLIEPEGSSEPERLIEPERLFRT